MIVATAGHVDHGKTSLVRALTGVDTDRLPEEKKRGLTIDLGFAYLPVAGGPTLGFIDVPGHERFVHNMLCGVAGVDAALLVVAADDGIMPQTREHLAILDLLGVQRGIVALTKVDRVSAERSAAVRADIAAVLAGTTLAGAPVFPCAAPSGLGIEALREGLDALARANPRRPGHGQFRLAVDRCFTIAGAGVVVTGTVFAGRLAAGAQVRALLAGVAARARTIHAHNAPAAEGRAGERCALNLSGQGLSASSIARGDWIVAGEAAAAVRKFDARLRVLAGEGRALRHWTPVHVHVGAADVTGRIAILGNDAIAPGESALVQLVLDRPMGAVHGDRFIVRDQSALRTIGGGRVIDIFPPARGRAHPARLDALRAGEQADAAAALRDLVAVSPAGVNLSRFAANRDLTADETDAAVAGVRLKRAGTGQHALGFTPERWTQLRERVLAAVAEWHQARPNSPGPSDAQVRAGCGGAISPDAMLALAEDLVASGDLRRSGGSLQLRGHHAGLDAADAPLWARIETVLRAAEAKPPLVAEVADQLGEAPKKVLALLERAARLKMVYRVGDNRFVTPDRVARLAAMVEALAAASVGGRVTAAAFRDRSGLGRNLSIDLLEFFDRVKFTRRAGDAHVVARPAREIFVDTVGTRPV